MTAELSLLTLLLVANASPVLVAGLLGARCAWPLDGGWLFGDGRALFGRSKTIRGVLAAVVLTTLVAPLLSLPIVAGLVAGLSAMIGDLSSSFVKRRMALVPGTSVPLLDQIPESLLPALLLMNVLDLDWPGVVIAVTAFSVIDISLTSLLQRLRADP